MNIVQIFKPVRDIPYRIPLSSEEESHNCTGKHKILKNHLAEYKTRFRVCDFRWSSIDLPDWLKKIDHEDNCTHLYLEIMLGGRWVTVDATWDKALHPVFKINEWDGKTDTDVAVTPTKIYPPERTQGFLKDEGEEFTRKDLYNNGNFYEAFNKWLEAIRKGD